MLLVWERHESDDSKEEPAFDFPSPLKNYHMMVNYHMH